MARGKMAPYSIKWKEVFIIKSSHFVRRELLSQSNQNSFPRELRFSGHRLHLYRNLRDLLQWLLLTVTMIHSPSTASIDSTISFPRISRSTSSNVTCSGSSAAYMGRTPERAVYFFCIGKSRRTIHLH